MRLFSTLFLLTFYISFAFSQTRTVGTTLFTEDVFEGYTLIAPIFTADSNTIYLIDNCGDVVHSWPTEEYTGLTAKLMPNGNLLRAYVLPNDHFSAGGLGGGVQIWDWDGNKIWDYKYSNEQHAQHHDITFMPDGSVLLLAWQTRDSADWVNAGRIPTNMDTSFVWTEKIVQIMPTGDTTGDIIWEWDMWDHLIQDYDSNKANYGVVADHPELMDINYLAWGGGDDDWMHGNAIDYNENLDQIILSCRHTHEVYVIDHSTTSQEVSTHSGGNQGFGGDILYRWGNPAAYDRGDESNRVLFAQHNSHWIEDGLNGAGNIMIFNNGERADTNYSTIDVIAPPVDINGAYTIGTGIPFGPTSLDWSHSAPTTDPLFAQFISGAQRLPNGNTLICEGTRGRILEIDESHEKVWEYVNPVNVSGITSQGDSLLDFQIPGTYNNWLFRAYKYAPNYEGFNGHALGQYPPIELNPLPDLCDELAVNSTEEIDFKIYPNPTNGIFRVDGIEGSAKMEVIDMAGRTIHSSEIIEIADISFIDNGVYIVRIENRDRLFSFRLIKE